MSKPKMTLQAPSLLIKGPYQGITGYDHYVREFTKGLVNQGANVQLFDFPEWSSQKHPDYQHAYWSGLVNHSVNAKSIIHFVMPAQVEIAKDKLNLNFTMFEADRIPSTWLEHNLQHDLVILPTLSSKESWITSGYPEERIRLCPLGINHELFQGETNALLLKDDEGRSVSDYAVRILNISDLTPRKNLISMLRVWIKSTDKNDGAILILKINYPWQRWIYKFFLDIKWMEKTLGKSRKQAAPILFLINQKFSDSQMRMLYAASTHYWSMSFGEGWDLCMMEAGAAGLHLIAPSHSAYPTYLNSNIADMMTAQPVPAKFFWAHGLHKLYANANWWKPDESVAGDYIWTIVKEGRKNKYNAAKKHIIDNFNWDKASCKLIDIINEVEG
ncbi:MAG: hypothetical protein GQ582_04830 [Methyloprofundus sp.]|nr:hypothetical protein [Methyloprofundus sp.]